MKYRGIDIFSGAGGLSLGAEMAGINVETAIEINKSAAETYKFNSPHTNVICDDITKLKTGSFIDKENPVFIIMGGPPCQGFSMSNTKNRSMFNPENQRMDILVPDDDSIQMLYDLMGEDVQPRKDFVFSKIDFSEIKE